jgi:hypothetical protein
MTTKAVAEFFCNVEQQPELAARLSKLPAVSREVWSAEVVRIARDAGHAFAPSDIAAAVEQQRRMASELSDGELDRVSGGTPEPHLRAIQGAGGTLYEGWPAKWYVPEIGG